MPAALLAALSLSPPPALATTPPAVSADAYILMDVETGAALAQKNADRRLSPASLTKLMTSYVIFQALETGELSLTQSARISKNAWAQRVSGSKMFLEAGEEVDIESLLKGLIIVSGNDAAIALAEALSGDEKTFAQEMNRAAAALNLANTNFKNASGLTRDGHYSSARDVAILLRDIMRRFPQFYHWYSEREYTYSGIRQNNRNALLGSYEGATGAKTGYTRRAGYCLAATARRGERQLIAVVMQTKSPRIRARESAQLLTYGFERYKNARFFAQDDTRKLPLWNGAASEVRVRPARDGVYTLLRSQSAEMVYRQKNVIKAPVQEGDVLGELAVFVDGEPRDTVAVIAAEAVAEGDIWQYLVDEFKLNALGHGRSGNVVLSEW